MRPYLIFSFFFFFHDPAPPEIYTLSLHDALPICYQRGGGFTPGPLLAFATIAGLEGEQRDRKSTRLNSSHLGISYAVFCLKKKKNITTETTRQHHCIPTHRRTRPTSSLT